MHPVSLGDWSEESVYVARGSDGEVRILRDQLDTLDTDSQTDAACEGMKYPVGIYRLDFTPQDAWLICVAHGEE